MLISQGVSDLINKQIKSEFAASQQYVAIAIYFDNEDLPDLAQFFYRQALEEREHAMKFVQYMLDVDSKPIIPPLPEFRNEFEDAADAVGFALAQERMVTDQINGIMTQALQDNDHASAQFLQWFVEEQVEEVSSMSELLGTIKHAGNMLLLVEDFVRRKAATEAAGEEE